MSNYGSLDTKISEIYVKYFQRYDTLLSRIVASEDPVVISYCGISTYTEIWHVIYIVKP